MNRIHLSSFKKMSLEEKHAVWLAESETYRRLFQSFVSGARSMNATCSDAEILTAWLQNNDWKKLFKM